MHGEPYFFYVNVIPKPLLMHELGKNSVSCKQNQDHESGEKTLQVQFFFHWKLKWLSYPFFINNDLDIYSFYFSWVLNSEFSKEWYY